MKEIKHIGLKKGMKVSELVDEMENAGFGAKKIAEARRIINEMIEDKECKVFLGIAGAMVPGGMKKVIFDMLNDVDVFVTTGANLTHDLIEALGDKHYHGDELVDDKELNKKGIDRMYNVFMKNSVYENLEDFFNKHFDELKECKNIKEFLWKLGEILSRENSAPPTPPQTPLVSVANSLTKQLAPSEVNKSILQKCYEKRIPIFCPGIADSGIGLMMWGRIAEGRQKAEPLASSSESQTKGETNIDVFGDMNEIIDIAWQAKKSGVIYIGGGLPKNFIQQSLQFSKGADYGVQITTEPAQPGGSSGAPLREGISWGKMKENANFVDVFCDATIALPLILAGIRN